MSSINSTMYQNKKGIQFGLRDAYEIDFSLAPIIASWLESFKKHSKDHPFMGASPEMLNELYPDADDHAWTDEMITATIDELHKESIK